MSNYVEQMWEGSAYGTNEPSKAGRVVAWVVGISAVVAFIAYSSQQYWYPYVAPYLNG